MGNSLRKLRTAAVLAALVAAILAARAPAARAQSEVEAGDTEFRVWAGGGHGLNGGTASDGLLSIGARYGWVLTKPFLPGPLRGRFEYAVDFIPIFEVYQPGGLAYGVSFNPIDLKWNFATRGHIVPYTELDGGVLFSTRNVPPGNSTVNFTTSSAFGAHFFLRRYDWNAEVRFMHISNAGLREPNPGINTLQGRIGFGLFKHHDR